MSFTDKSYDFSAMPAGTDVAGPTTGLYWMNTPKTEEIAPGKGLKIVPKPGTDFWRKTYTSPPADRSSGHALFYKMPADLNKWSVSTRFSMTLVDLYDQAGLMIFIDKLHWLKTGIEFEGGVPCMSCVVTNDESDWNYLNWTTSSDIQIRVRVERYATVLDCTVEFWDKGVWRILREAPITLSSSDVSVGLMCCAPKSEEGKPSMESVFKTLEINKQ